MRPVMQKQPRYENRKLLDLAHEAPCFLGIIGICDRRQSGSVPAHSNRLRHGRGTGNKSHDCYTVPACPACHYWLDYGNSPREEKEAAFMKAWEEWILYVFDNDLVKVA